MGAHEPHAVDAHVTVLHAVHVAEAQEDAGQHAAVDGDLGEGCLRQRAAVDPYKDPQQTRLSLRLSVR